MSWMSHLPIDHVKAPLPLRLSASSKSRLFSTIAYAYDAAFFQNASEGEFRAEEGVLELHFF
jgi:hypothetical protein